jgi:uncharacterized protein YndB with AHSA1/START domain
MTNNPEAPIVIRRVLPAPIEEVFAAWVDVDGIQEWFSPIGTASMTADCRPGGRFRLVMSDESQSIEHTGKYRVVDPPNLLVFTWRSQFTGGRDTLVTVRLTPSGPDRTELELTHELLPTDEVQPHTGGWGTILDRLQAYVQRRDGSRAG